MNKKRPLITGLLDFSGKELTEFVRTALELMRADKRIRLEEESIISLIPDFIRIAKDNETDEETKSSLRKKLIDVSVTIQMNEENSGFDSSHVVNLFNDHEKRRTFILMLFIMAGSDTDMDRRETAFIMERFATPWNYSTDEIISMLEEESCRMFIPAAIILALKHYNS